MKTARFNSFEMKQLIKTSEFISECTPKQRAHILNEILMVNPLCVWDKESQTLSTIESVSILDKKIQLNIGKCVHDT